MGIFSRNRSRESGATVIDLSLARRLEQLAEVQRSSAPEADHGGPAEVKTSRVRESSQNTTTVAVADPVSEVGSAAPETQPPLEHKQSDLEEVAIANAKAAADQEASAATRDLEMPAPGEPLVAAPEQQGATGTAADAQNATEKVAMGFCMTPPRLLASPLDMGKEEMFRVPECDREPQQLENRLQEVAETPVEAGQEHSPSAPASQGDSQQALEPVKVAFAWAATIGEDTLASARQLLADLQDTKREFEAELQERFDGALAEFERRVSSHAAFDEVVGRLEQKSNLAQDNILHEVEEQTLSVFNTVVTELRSFRDQCIRVIQERAASLERTTQQALELKNRIEESFPQAEKILQSLSVKAQDASAQLEAASAAFSEELRDSRKSLSQEIEIEKETLNALTQERKREEMRMKEEIERFRRESAAAYDIFGDMADQSLQRLNAGVDEANARARAGLEDLAARIEQRILSGGFIEKVTEQVEQAAQGVVERAVERMKVAGAEAESTSASLAQASQRVVDRFGRARQEIESRLDSLMGEQHDLFQTTMAGFQREAAEDLGNVVERVVSQSAQELDERLRTLCNDLLVSTGKQIDGAARVTLDTVYTGLKEAFEPTPVEAELVQPAISTSHGA